MTNSLGAQFDWNVIGIGVIGTLVLFVLLLLVALVTKNPRVRIVALGLLVLPVLLAVGLSFLFVTERFAARNQRAYEQPWGPVDYAASMVEVSPGHLVNINSDKQPLVKTSPAPSGPRRSVLDPASPEQHPKYVRDSTALRAQLQKTPVEDTAGSGGADSRESAGHRMTVILKPADAKGTAGGDIAVDIRTEEGKQTQVTALLLALANALRKAVADSPSAETAAGVVAKVATAPPLASTPAADATAKRPAWVETAPQLVGDVYLMPLQPIGPYVSRFECDRKLPEELQRGLSQFIEDYLGPEAKGRVSLPKQYVESHLVRETWQEHRKFDLTSTDQVPMIRLHVLLAFDNDAKDRLRQAWQRILVFDRLQVLGLGLAFVLGLLTTFWAYLRIDLATSGAYRNRLRFATALLVVLLAVLAAATFA